jgi:electron transfer flavoprotein beta subunit
MTPGAIFDAWRNKEITEWNRADVPVEDSNIGYRGSPTRVAKSFPKTMKSPGMKIEEGVEESVEFIFDKLKEKYLL